MRTREQNSNFSNLVNFVKNQKIQVLWARTLYNIYIDINIDIVGLETLKFRVNG